MTTNIDIVVEDFNSPFTSMDRSFKQIYIIYTHILHIYITKEALNLKCFRQDGLGFYIYRTFHPKTEEYTFFSLKWNILQDRSNARLQNKLQCS